MCQLHAVTKSREAMLGPKLAQTRGFPELAVRTCSLGPLIGSSALCLLALPSSITREQVADLAVRVGWDGVLLLF